MTDDRQLLRRYVAQGSEDAFAEIVRQHSGLVYSAALRQVRDPDLARDVAQTVFIHLAQKAPSIPSGMVLAGWLHRDTRFTALDLIRSENRRAHREQEALVMNTSDPSEWENIRPLLDEALQELSPTDRDALLLRFFEQQDLASVGAALGSTADAARKRVERALERLRDRLIKRGVTTTGAALGLVLSTHAVEALPEGLTLSLVSGSTAAVSAATASAAAGSGSVSALADILIMAKTKILVGALLIAGAATPLLLQEKAVAEARAEHAALIASTQAVVDGGGLQNGADQVQAPDADSEAAVQRDREELKRLRAEVASLQANVAKLKPIAAPTTARASRSAKRAPALATFHLSELRDAGQSTGAALLETQMWAILHGDTNRMAQLMAFEPDTDMRIVQTSLERFQKEQSEKGADQVIAEAEAAMSEFRLLEEVPAADLDRWLVCEVVAADGKTDTVRIRVRSTSSGWKVVVGRDGQPVQEHVDPDHENPAATENVK